MGDGETSVDVGFRQLMAVPYVPVRSGLMGAFLSRLDEMIGSPERPLLKEDLVAEIQKVLPEFQHAASLKALDQRM